VALVVAAAMAATAELAADLLMVLRIQPAAMAAMADLAGN